MPPGYHDQGPLIAVFTQVSALTECLDRLTNRPGPWHARARRWISPMTTAEAARPDPEGHHDDLSAKDLDGLSLVVPDDARELDTDRELWLTENVLPPVETRGLPGLSRRRRLSLTAGVLIGARCWWWRCPVRSLGCCNKPPRPGRR